MRQSATPAADYGSLLCKFQSCIIMVTSAWSSLEDYVVV
jgi:hypothetical protein